MQYLFVTFLLSCLITYLVVRFDGLHLHLSADHDLLGVQKFHSVAVPRIGGVGIYFGLLISALLISSTDTPHAQSILLFLIPASLIFAVGLVEDLTKRVSVFARLLAAMIAAFLGSLLFNATLTSLDVPVLDFLFHFNLIAIGFTAISVAGVTHAVNLIDGFNGLSAVICIATLLALAIIAYVVGDQLIFIIGMASAGAAAGFLAWNYPKAKIFLGDGGAYLLGFIIAELSILLVERNHQVSVLFPFLLMIYPVFETLFTMYRRIVLRGKSAGLPDAMHLHQIINKRLVRWGVKCGVGPIRSRGNARTSPFLWALHMAAVIPAVIFWNNALVLFGFILLFVVTYVWLYLSIIRFRTRRFFGRLRLRK